MHQFMRTIRSLPADQFTQSMNGWSPRDVVAHFIGWNRATIDVAEAMRKGQTPDVFVDPGEDFSKANAEFVRRYDSTDMVELLRQLELAYQALAQYLYTLEPAEWTREVSVPFAKEPVTIEWSVAELAADYDNHRQEIETWQR